MEHPGITWKLEAIEDVQVLSELPAELERTLRKSNGFILQDGALHVRGACLTPDWHSLRAAWRGPTAFHILYDDVLPSDIPFAEDQIGDQFLIRNGVVLRLSAETGEIEQVSKSLGDFFTGVSNDIERFLNVGLSHKLQPGHLLHAYPPFCFRESGRVTHLRALPASEVIHFHADLAKQIKNVPDGGQVKLDFGE